MERAITAMTAGMAGITIGVMVTAMAPTVTSTMTACPTATTASRKTGIVGEPEAMSSL
jgi:hypothetical protein